MSKKLKKQSTILPLLRLLESQTPIFLDRDQGNKRMPQLLQEAGITVQWHSQRFTDTTQDDVWIRDVAKQGWIIVSSDKGLETDPDNRLAVIESKAKVFILEENNARAVHWASALIVSRDRIYEAVNDNEGPFYMNVLRKSTSLVWKFRVPSVEDSAATASPADVSKVKTRKSNSAE